ncbi:response regulator [Anabaena cylindrica FACHB-243]|uniref:Response regulator receiver protein n=1 Tax=Anabaena cylindrica (strain ATCC 27899 / PCC 7122) TaxID=272123 RepID=K9ZKC8_ANACC|nr:MULTISPECIES: response regulator [Anabaena]AFZ59209.1 response regulator receiver protein [Anabaena cylindrica PCC 7122]MBD2416559.1 response regulator [Anabaena cylindrica FACHB-243]MBY5280942.1 response regulator [Anabaena sp. CCAP 1446/1C]MBY5311615.1 response regulator [Anabaena sp. CCAP 1446/1C]MCM2407499.1 response regulator [Anabaena sp. CCAP 1446/1C]
MNTENLEKRKVLIADDDEDCREMLSFLLDGEGWDVIEAKDGQEALEKVVQCQPNLLILDNRMPELTGIEVYQHLQIQGINLAIVFATAYGYPEELVSTLGVSYWVTKPYDIPTLLDTIESAYENSITFM